MIYRQLSINNHDYKILESYMIKYHDLVKIYQHKPTDMCEIKYKRIKAIVTGITDLYNNHLSVFEQNLVKLTWWQKEDDETISKVLNRGMPTIQAFREKILSMMVDATGYVR